MIVTKYSTGVLNQPKMRVVQFRGCGDGSRRYDEPLQRPPVETGKLRKLNHIDAPVAGLTLGNVRLRLRQPRCHFNLSKASFTASLPESDEEGLVGWVVY